MDDPVPVLLRQHDELLAKLDEAANGLAAVEPALALLVAYLHSELETHFAIEERELFPRLAGRREIAPDTIALLGAEHAQARRLAAELAAALRHGSAAERIRLAQDLIDLLRAHVAKEDAMLLAVAAAIPMNSSDLPIFPMFVREEPVLAARAVVRSPRGRC